MRLPKSLPIAAKMSLRVVSSDRLVPLVSLNDGPPSGWRSLRDHVGRGARNKPGINQGNRTSELILVLTGPVAPLPGWYLGTARPTEASKRIPGGRNRYRRMS